MVDVISCVRDAACGRANATANAALALLLASHHLDNLSRLEILPASARMP